MITGLNEQITHVGNIDGSSPKPEERHKTRLRRCPDSWAEQSHLYYQNSHTF